MEIVDQASGAWGHINVDEIVEYEQVPVGVGEAPPAAAFALHQNTPNPFNPTTRITFDLPAAGRAHLAVFDVRGRLVRQLVDAPLAAGPNVAVWDGTRSDGSRCCERAVLLPAAVRKPSRPSPVDGAAQIDGCAVEI
jgi:hypothetical protein